MADQEIFLGSATNTRPVFTVLVFYATNYEYFTLIAFAHFTKLVVHISDGERFCKVINLKVEIPGNFIS